MPIALRPGDGNRVLPQRRPVTGFGERAQLRLRDVQELVAVHHDRVARAADSRALSRARRCARLPPSRRCGSSAVCAGSRSPPFASAAARSANSLQPPAAGHETHADFDETDVAFERRDRAVAVHDELAAAAEREAVDRRDGRHQRELERLRRLLELARGAARLRRAVPPSTGRRRRSGARP